MYTSFRWVFVFQSAEPTVLLLRALITTTILRNSMRYKENYG